jgi:hypothetical protein
MQKLLLGVTTMVVSLYVIVVLATPVLFVPSNEHRRADQVFLLVTHMIRGAVADLRDFFTLHALAWLQLPLFLQLKEEKGLLL